jgi:alkylation response protein AidB-like acyl-CoA dehydrogenase
VVDERDEAAIIEAVDELVAAHPPATTSVTDFLQARYDAGLAWVWFPDGYGGRGLAPALQTTVDRAVHERGGANTTVGPIGYMMTAAAIEQYAADEVKHRFLPRIFRHDDDWVQLFSEPGAGSDLAGLATRAERDGDEWVVNGQKVWSSGAMGADWGLLLARTNPDVPKHNGITAFLIDMHQPGVDPRPLRNIAGTAEFAEVFFADARVPDELRLGPVDGGWGVALSVLMTERVNFTVDFVGAGAPRPDAPLQAVLDLVRAGRPVAPATRGHLVRVWIENEVANLTNQRAAAALTAGTPGPEGSLGKVASTELTKRVANLAMEVLGAEAMLLPRPYPSPDEPGLGDALDDLRFGFLASPSNTIMGGTSEIQRNNIAERVLGLPGEPRADKGIPWRDVPRSG